MVVRPHTKSLLAGLRSVAVCAVVVLGATAVASAQPGKRPQPKPGASDKGDGGKPAGDAGKGDKGKSDKPKVFDFTGLQFEGRLRTPQLLYFLDRASEELERASLERRSFIPEMVRSVDEDDL